MFSYILKLLKNDKGEVYTSTAVKILIAVVVGALLFAGLAAMNKTTYLPRLQSGVSGSIDRTKMVSLEEADEMFASWRLRIADKFQEEIYGGDSDDYEFMADALNDYALKYDPNATNTGCNVDNYIYCVYNINQEEKGKPTLTQSEFESLRLTPEGKIQIMEVVNFDA